MKSLARASSKAIPRKCLNSDGKRTLAMKKRMINLQASGNGISPEWRERKTPSVQNQNVKGRDLRCSLTMSVPPPLLVPEVRDPLASKMSSRRILGSRLPSSRSAFAISQSVSLVQNYLWINHIGVFGFAFITEVFLPKSSITSTFTLVQDTVNPGQRFTPLVFFQNHTGSMRAQVFSLLFKIRFSEPHQTRFLSCWRVPPTWKILLRSFWIAGSSC